MDLRRYAPDLRQSGILIVSTVYGALIVINASTIVFGPQNVLVELNKNQLAPILAIIVFDTPWTLTGLVGLVLLLGAVLFATPVEARRNLSLFFVSSSILIGIVAGALWDGYYDTTGFVGVGASAIAIAGQGVLFTLSLFGILRLLRQGTKLFGRMTSYWWHSFMLIFGTLIFTTLLFVVVLQSIFVPTELYNWRVHEIAFFMAIVATAGYEGFAWRSEALDGRIPIDDMLVNFRYDDLNYRFPQALPKLKVSFQELSEGTPGDFRPRSSEIIVPRRFEGEDYRRLAKDFDGCLLHGMVHAELYFEGGPWEHGRQEAKERFNALAAEVGAVPES